MVCESKIGILNLILKVFYDLTIFIPIEAQKGEECYPDHTVSDGKETQEWSSFSFYYGLILFLLCHKQGKSTLDIFEPVLSNKIKPILYI